MSVFICLSEGYKEICEGCESKKSKIAVRTRVRAREEGRVMAAGSMTS